MVDLCFYFLSLRRVKSGEGEPKRREGGGRRVALSGQHRNCVRDLGLALAESRLERRDSREERGAT